MQGEQRERVRTKVGHVDHTCAALQDFFRVLNKAASHHRTQTLADSGVAVLAKEDGRMAFGRYKNTPTRLLLLLCHALLVQYTGICTHFCERLHVLLIALGCGKLDGFTDALFGGRSRVALWLCHAHIGSRLGSFVSI